MISRNPVLPRCQHTLQRLPRVNRGSQQSSTSKYRGSPYLWGIQFQDPQWMPETVNKLDVLWLFLYIPIIKFKL